MCVTMHAWLHAASAQDSTSMCVCVCMCFMCVSLHMCACVRLTQKYAQSAEIPSSKSASRTTRACVCVRDAETIVELLRRLWRAQAVVKRQCAALQCPVEAPRRAGATPSAGAVRVASLEEARHCLRSILGVNGAEPRDVPLPNIKRFFRSA